MSPGYGSTEAVGGLLFSAGIVPFELATALLIVAVVGAIAVARSRHAKKKPSTEENETRAAIRRAASPARRSAPAEQGGGGMNALGQMVEHYVLLSSILFTIGAIGFVVRRNVLVQLMSIELMLNAVNLMLVASKSHARRFDERPDVRVLHHRGRCG